MTIDKICKKYGIKNYIINDDGTIDVNENVNLFNRGLIELPLIFNKVSGDFICSRNKLSSLKGCPRWVGGYFTCSGNGLTSLEFSPDYVNESFVCNSNNLTNLIGSPKQVGGGFVCFSNPSLITPNGCSERIGGVFNCLHTPIGSIFNNVDQNFLHAFNFYKVIKDDTVNLKRLRYVMDLYDQPIDLDKIQKYYRLV